LGTFLVIYEVYIGTWWGGNFDRKKDEFSSLQALTRPAPNRDGRVYFTFIRITVTK